MDRAGALYAAVLRADVPLMDGTGGDPEGMIERAVAVGWKPVTPVADTGPRVGFIGFFLDSEGDGIGVLKPPQT